MTPLYLLAFDHRTAFRDRLPGAGSREAIVGAKRVIWDGFRQAVAGGVPRESAGVLIDEEYGEEIAREVPAEGVTLAMPVEAAGRKEFEFAYGDAFGERLERFRPDFAKALVPYDPHGDADLNARQRVRLRTLSDWLHAHDGRLMLEVVVPAHGERVELMLAAIGELRDSGVAPAVWKVDGLAREDDCRRVVARCTAEAPGEVGVIVLGRNAPYAEVAAWLGAAARTPGYVGFAVGRTIWGDPLEAYLAGELPREEAAARIASAYRRLVDSYRA